MNNHLQNPQQHGSFALIIFSTSKLLNFISKKWIQIWTKDSSLSANFYFQVYKSKLLLLLEIIVWSIIIPYRIYIRNIEILSLTIWIWQTPPTVQSKREKIIAKMLKHWFWIVTCGSESDAGNSVPTLSIHCSTLLPLIKCCGTGRAMNWRRNERPNSEEGYSIFLHNWGSWGIIKTKNARIMMNDCTRLSGSWLT